MYAFVTILIAIICLLIIAVVLVQNPKGGGLGAGFGGGGGGSVGGVQKTTDFLERATWSLAIALLVLSIMSNLLIDDSSRTTIDNNGDNIEIVDPIDE